MTLASTVRETIGFDPSEPAFRENPYRYYDELRKRTPVYRSPAGFFVLSRYDDCVAVLGDPRFGHPGPGDRVAAPALLGGSVDQRHFMLFMNPPNHTRVRAAVRRVLTPRVINGLREYTTAQTRRLLATAGDELEVISGLAHPLALNVICELLGIPPADRTEVAALARDFLAGIDPTFALSADRHAARDAAFAELDRYFVELVGHRGRRSSDLVAGLVGCRELTARELCGAATLLFIAGHGTTTNLIGNGMLALVRHPEARHRYRLDASVAASGIEELLRYDAPSQLTVRTALRDVEIGEHTVRRGEQVVLLRGAANRDPAAFPRPDALDLARPDNRHLAFSDGIHRCLGAPLARMQARTAFHTLLASSPDPELATTRLSYRDSLLIRGLVSLPVRLR